MLRIELTTNLDTLAQLLELAKNGLRLFPLRICSKEPAIANWPAVASSDSEQITAWAQRFPRANWAIATGRGSGIFVLDSDGLEGQTWIEMQCQMHGAEWAYTRRVRTPGKLRVEGVRWPGMHFVFCFPEPEIRNSTGKLAPGVDIRGEGGYVAIPPSEHPDGGFYEYFDDGSILEAPQWLINALVKSQNEKSSPAPADNGTGNENGHGGKIPEGQRNAVLASLAGSMRHKGFNADAVLAALQAHNQAHCIPPLPEDEVQKIAASVARYEPAASPTSELVVLCGSEVKREHLDFLWPRYLPKGKLVHMGGNSGQGKTPVTMDLIARTTKGLPWPDGTPNLLGPRAVLLLNIEDSLEDTILPRLDLAGGDDSRLFYVRGTRITTKTGTLEKLVALDRDLTLLSDKARTIEGLVLIVIDPITNYLGRLSMNKEEDIRTILSPLAALANELKVTVLTIGHFNRRERGTDPLHRMMGAAAFSGVARVVYAVGPDPDSEREHDHVMTQVRGATGVTFGLKYHTEMIEREWDGETSGVIRVGWDGKTAANANDTVDAMSRKDKCLLGDAAALLRDFLSAADRPAADCMAYLKEAGFDLQKINPYDVRRRAQVNTDRRGKVHWWSLLP